MLNIKRDPSCPESIPFIVVEVQYPDQNEWDIPAFEALKKSELEKLMATKDHYDRKERFTEDPYYRYFKKFKKSYPVMMQLESVLLKGREFPSGHPINEVPFLTELMTGTLTGAHDIDCIEGDLVLFCGTEKVDFPGIGGRDSHIYPGDLSGRDDKDIILSMIAGADDRTCLHENSTHIMYPFFGMEGLPKERMLPAVELLISYVKTLAPTAEIHIIEG